jgi:hypothetical protein
MSFRLVDEDESGFGWLIEERYARTSHALAADGQVWLVDPVDVDGLDERVRGLGEPAGVIQLLDRHNRDCAAIAARLGVPHHVVPESLPGTPFEFVRVARIPRWHEVALWWPHRRILVCADALGTIGFFTAGGGAAGVHPFLRLAPPKRLATLDPLHLLVGHGAGLHGEETAESVRGAIATARTGLPRWAARMARAAVRARRR